MRKRVGIFRDPEFYFLLFYNLAIIVLYALDKVEPMFVIWAFLLQSIFMGAQFAIHNFIRVTRASGLFPLKNHAVTGFFVVHFGGFHFVYIIFLMVMSTDIGDIDVLVDMIKYVRYTAIFLLINLVLFTGREVIPSAPSKITPNIFMTYLRVIPMHLVIIFGFNNSDFVIDAFIVFIDGFIVFMIIKLILDFVFYLFLGGEEIAYDDIELEKVSKDVDRRFEELENKKKPS